MSEVRRNVTFCPVSVVNRTGSGRGVGDLAAELQTRVGGFPKTGLSTGSLWVWEARTEAIANVLLGPWTDVAIETLGLHMILESVSSLGEKG